uniref:Uncharacterized protein n=1 Tax=Paramormyrops kingsleyae TaxID=1676925 RepID=A0A3B3S0J0_9TELE
MMLQRQIDFASLEEAVKKKMRRFDSMYHPMAVCCAALLVVMIEAKDTVCGSTLKIPSKYYEAQPRLPDLNGNINNRSLSAWTWKLNHVESRIPKTITEAVCSFMYCLNPKARPGVAELDERFNSVPIHQSMLVLNHVKSLSCYQASFISIVVGCTCVKAKTT